MQTVASCSLLKALSTELLSLIQIQPTESKKQQICQVRRCQHFNITFSADNTIALDCYFLVMKVFFVFALFFPLEYLTGGGLLTEIHVSSDTSANKKIIPWKGEEKQKL